jgi:hypothetical protein
MAGNCKLCDNETDKFPKSHIIPDFMYKSLKNEKSQILRLHMPENKPKKPIFIGFYDTELLCPACEAKISKLESYAEKVLYGSSNIPMPKVQPTTDPILQEVINIDYKTFKLFLLSILWRASKSKHEFFKYVNLGEKHEQVLKSMLLGDDPGDEQTYPIALIIPKGQVGKDVGILPPFKSKNEDNATRYIFIIAEMVYVFHVSQHGMDKLHSMATIKQNNTMQVIFVPTKRSDFYLQLYSVKEEISKTRAKDPANRLGQLKYNPNA